MNKKSSRFGSIPVLLIFVILSALLLFQLGAVQTFTAHAQTCGLPGLPPCDGNPPPSTDVPTRPRPTRTPSPTSTATPSPTSSLTPSPTNTATLAATSTNTFTPTVIPSVTRTVTRTPNPWYLPPFVLKMPDLLPPPPSFLVGFGRRPNMEAFKVEITQAIQCLDNPNCADNSVRLFIGKPTMVRLYVHLTPNSWYSQMKGIGGEICPGIHGEEGCYNPIHSINYVTLEKKNPDVSLFRGDINSTLNFILPSSWTYGNFTAYVNMRGEDFLLESTFKDNFITQPFQEIPSQRLDVAFVAVKSRGYLADLNERWAIRDWLALSYPTSTIQVWWMTTYINDNTNSYDWNDKSGGCGDGWGDLLDDLDDYRGNLPQVFYGMVHQSTLTGTPYSGCGSFSSKVAAGVVNTGDRTGPVVAAQEIGHSMLRNHAPGCSAGNPDMSYPNSDATLDEYGMDVVRKQVYVPGLSFDFMGYCGGEGTKWTSMYTYNAIAGLLPDGIAMAQSPGLYGFAQDVPVSFYLGGNGLQAADLIGNQPTVVRDPSPSTSQYLVGSGFVTPQKVNLKKGFFLLGSDSITPRTPEAGPYTFELLDAQGKVLSSLPFKTLEESNAVPTDTGAFHLTIPWMDAARGYQFKYKGTVILSRMADPHHPGVGNIVSTGGSHWPNTGTLTLHWNPVYDGGNPLRYLVQYSRDNGVSWSMLATNLDQPTLDVDAALVPGSSNALIRVYTSDGFNTGEAVSAPFTVENKTPEVHIGWTADGAQVAAGDPVFLNGAATDAQDGPISGSDLHWFVDNGPLGDGDTLITSLFGVGDHVITLAATNAEGMTGTASIHLTVLPAAPKPQSTAEMSFPFRLLLWAIPLAGILLLVLGAILILRKRRRPAG